MCDLSLNALYSLRRKFCVCGDAFACSAKVLYDRKYLRDGDGNDELHFGTLFLCPWEVMVFMGRHCGVNIKCAGSAHAVHSCPVRIAAHSPSSHAKSVSALPAVGG
jgi:hypothetical protein